MVASLQICRQKRNTIRFRSPHIIRTHVTLFPETSLKWHLGYFEMEIVLKTAALLILCFFLVHYFKVIEVVVIRNCCADRFCGIFHMFLDNRNCTTLYGMQEFCRGKKYIASGQLAVFSYNISVIYFCIADLNPVFNNFMSFINERIITLR